MLKLTKRETFKILKLKYLDLPIKLMLNQTSLYLLDKSFLNLSKIFHKTIYPYTLRKRFVNYRII